MDQKNTSTTSVMNLHPNVHDQCHCMIWLPILWHELLRLFVQRSTIDTRKYAILSEKDVRHRQEEDINKVCSALLLSRGSASILLRNYNWSVEKVHEAWFADEEGVRGSVGLMHKPMVSYPGRRRIKCRICFDMFHHRRMYAAPCGHLFCVSCWKNYVRISISDGPSCLMLRCPDPGCVVAVDQKMVNRLVCGADKKKYSRFLLRSYGEANNKVKCPAPGCENYVELLGGSENYDVTCNCKHRFCWNCLEEFHHPVKCDIVAKWVMKNSSDAKNTKWLIANTKPCPKCRRPIEKNDGCICITCVTPCNFKFCWLCLGAWSGHGIQTGCYDACNIYSRQQAERKLDNDQREREMAKLALERYAHYYERWAANQDSRAKAIAGLQIFLDRNIKRLSSGQVSPVSQLKFITDAWLQIIEFRRMLKWTYAYGYYLPENEPEKKKLFEYLQSQAESSLELLHECAEKELKVFLDDKAPSDKFNEFSTKLIGLTNVTRNYFENLVRGLENGLTELQDP